MRGKATLWRVEHVCTREFRWQEQGREEVRIRELPARVDTVLAEDDAESACREARWWLVDEEPQLDEDTGGTQQVTAVRFVSVQRIGKATLSWE